MSDLFRKFSLDPDLLSSFTKETKQKIDSLVDCAIVCSLSTVCQAFYHEHQSKDCHLLTLVNIINEIC